MWGGSPEEPKRVVRKREEVKVTETKMSAPENSGMTMEGMMRMMMELEASRDTRQEEAERKREAERERREEEQDKREQERELRWQEREERMMTRWQNQMDAASTRARPGSEVAKIPVVT